MKSRIDYIREDKPDGSGYTMEGRMMGTVGGCLDILAYCVVSLARQSGDIPPGILMKLLEKVKKLDEKGVGKNDDDVLTNVQIPLSLLDVLVKKEKESEEQDDDQ
jgi:hypothetical protein